MSQVTLTAHLSQPEGSKHHPHCPHHAHGHTSLLSAWSSLAVSCKLAIPAPPAHLLGSCLMQTTVTDKPPLSLIPFL